MKNPDWVAPKSPGGLLQEQYLPDEWKVLVCCILLNRTKRAQVEPIIGKLFSKYPNAATMASADVAELANLLRTLGFQNRRAKSLAKFSDEFLQSNWTDPRELHGVGEYAARGWEMLCAGIVGDEPPPDHALLYYYEHLKSIGY